MEQTLSEELSRLREEHRQLSDLLALIQELTTAVVSSESEADIFRRGFATLGRVLPFDVGVAVMLEQNLDLHVSSRADGGHLLNDTLVSRVRATLAQMIPVSFESTDVVVKSESEHASSTAGAAGIRWDVAALIERRGRTAGLVILLRDEAAFTRGDRQVLSIYSTQISMLLDALHARQQIRNLADTDDLTGIWNRRYFRRELAHEAERARTFGVPLSLLLFDIDDFKDINDGFGHVVGDVVLSELCGAVRETLRPADTFARCGGDEFAVILPHTDAAGAAAVADRLLNRIAALPVATDDEAAIQCSISIGIAELLATDDGGTDLMRRADEKLYESKRRGKNRYTA